jgi:hypothetical protein
VRLAAVVAGVLAVAAAGCGGGGSKSVQTTTATRTITTTNPTGTAGATVTTHGRFHYPAAVTENYMRSCLRNGSVTKAYCACTLDKLSNNVSTADFARIGLSGGHIPTRVRRFIRRAAVACANKL